MTAKDLRRSHLTVGEVLALISERDSARAALDEREADMHSRIRAGYDCTVADCWRAKVAEVEARAEVAEQKLAALVEAAKERVGACSQTAERERDEARAALVRLHQAAVSFEAPLPERYDGPLRDDLWKALASIPADLAEAQRREWMAQALDAEALWYREARHLNDWRIAVANYLDMRAANLRGGK